MGQLMKKIIPCREIEEFLEQIQHGKSLKMICSLRTENCLEWYTRRAVFYKRMFNILSVVNLGVPLVSTALMSLGRGKEIGIILSAITSLSTSLLALYNVREKWTMYRTAAEHIKSQYSLYCGEVFPYDGQDGHAKYLTMLETYMAGIHIQWYDMQKEEKKEEKRL